MTDELELSNVNIRVERIRMGKQVHRAIDVFKTAPKDPNSRGTTVVITEVEGFEYAGRTGRYLPITKPFYMTNFNKEFQINFVE